MHLNITQYDLLFEGLFSLSFYFTGISHHDPSQVLVSNIIFYDIAEILLKLALNTNYSINQSFYFAGATVTTTHSRKSTTKSTPKKTEIYKAKTSLSTSTSTSTPCSTNGPTNDPTICTTATTSHGSKSTSFCTE